MILVDTSVWIRFLMNRAPHLTWRIQLRIETSFPLSVVIV